MAITSVSLLAFAVLGVFVRPRWAPNWAAPILAAVIVIGLGWLHVGGTRAGDALAAAKPLTAPLAFLLCAVPLTVMLDRLGFFASLAAVLDTGRRPQLALWCLAAAVTTFLNLDAAVVLLTPLYIRIARRHGLGATALAFQPVLLACLASSALPISNLTNLIAAAQLHLGLVEFVLHLGPASLIATCVGWWVYKRAVNAEPAAEAFHDPVDRRALLLGGPVVAFVVLGFTVGGLAEIPAWAVALVADVALMVMTRKMLRLPDLPFGAAALAVGLGIVATTTAARLGLDRLFHGEGLLDQFTAVGFGGLGADIMNNLPALLVALPAIHHHAALVWPVLFGVNFFPIFVLHGSLAGLLWRDMASRLGVDVSPGQYSRIGLKVGGPAVAAGLAILLAVGALLGS